MPPAPHSNQLPSPSSGAPFGAPFGASSGTSSGTSQDTDAGAVTVAALGDVENDVTALRDLLGAVSRDARPVFGVLLGDTVRRASPRRYSLLRRAIDRAAPPFPVLAVPGERDRADDGDWFAAAFGARTWSLRHGDVVFVGVDNAAGPLSAESVGTLARAPVAGSLVVFAHRPLHVEGECGPDARLRAARLRELIAAACGRRIDAVISGDPVLRQEVRDEDGTLHLIDGRVPGPGPGPVPGPVPVPGREAVRTAVLVTVRPRESGGLTVRHVQVPGRWDLRDEARRLAVRVADRAWRIRPAAAL